MYVVGGAAAAASRGSAAAEKKLSIFKILGIFVIFVFVRAFLTFLEVFRGVGYYFEEL